MKCIIELHNQILHTTKSNYCIGVDSIKIMLFVLFKINQKHQVKKTISTFKEHIKEGSVLIHDCEHSHKALVAKLTLKTVEHKAQEILKLKIKIIP